MLHIADVTAAAAEKMQLIPPKYLPTSSALSQMDGKAVSAVCAALDGNTIRAIKAAGPEASRNAAISLRASLEALARLYAGTWASKTDDALWGEMVRFVGEQFAHLSLGEIEVAFRLAAAEKLDVESSRLQAFGGEWSVGALGAVLASYDRYRKEIIKAKREADAAAKTQAESLPKDPAELEAVRIERLKSGQVEQKYITAQDYKILRKAGLLEMDKEKWKGLLQRATELVRRECAGKLLYPEQRKWAQDMIAQTEAHSTGISDDNWAHIRAAAERLAVREWLGS